MTQYNYQSNLNSTQNILWELCHHISQLWSISDFECITYVCNNDIISCGGNTKIHLKAIFHSMSLLLGDREKHFQQFYLNNTVIIELPENTFEDITFDSIQIEEAYNKDKHEICDFYFHKP